MPQHTKLASTEEINAASKVGFRGAIVGAARWGVYTGLLGIGAYFYSPVFRGLTIQFKVFLQMSGMMAGAVIEAEERMREHEKTTRAIRRARRDQEVWRRYEAEFEGDERSGK